MTSPETKTVILVDRDLPVGLAVNAASIAACMITMARPELMGPPTESRDGMLPGVVLTPLPVLTSTRPDLGLAWEQVRGAMDLTPFPFSTLAQSCKSYQEYLDKMAHSSLADLELAALGIVGPKKAVNSLTGGLALYPPKEG